MVEGARSTVSSMYSSKKLEGYNFKYNIGIDAKCMKTTPVVNIKGKIYAHPFRQNCNRQNRACHY